MSLLKTNGLPWRRGGDAQRGALQLQWGPENPLFPVLCVDGVRVILNSSQHNHIATPPAPHPPQTVGKPPFLLWTTLRWPALSLHVHSFPQLLYCQTVHILPFNAFSDFSGAFPLPHLHLLSDSLFNVVTYLSSFFFFCIPIIPLLPVPVLFHFLVPSFLA